MPESILKEFEKRKSIFLELGKKCETIIFELISENGITPHQIVYRLKSKNSLEGKINSKNGKYQCLNDITDICGLRIITYLDSDVDKIAKIIEDEFSIDRDNSVDKRKHEANQFGYNSLHYVASFDEKRLQMYRGQALYAGHLRPFREIVA